MAFSVREDDAAFAARTGADVVRLAAFVHVDWPDTPIRASSHIRSVTIDGNEWAGVGAVGTIETDKAENSGAAQRWTATLKGLPATPVLVADQAEALGRDANVYLGAFDAGWTDPILSLTFAGYFNGRKTKFTRAADGMRVDISGEFSDLQHPRRAVQHHWADGAGAPGDTAQKLLHTVARSIKWPAL